MTAEFHNTIYLHGPHAPTVHWVEGDPGWATIITSGASLLVKTVAEADELIKAAVVAKDLLLAAQEPKPTCLSCGAATDLVAAHEPAREGTAARTEWYCHDTAACYDRRHPPLAFLVPAEVTP